MRPGCWWKTMHLCVCVTGGKSYLRKEAKITDDNYFCGLMEPMRTVMQKGNNLNVHYPDSLVVYFKMPGLSMQAHQVYY